MRKTMGISGKNKFTDALKSIHEFKTEGAAGQGPWKFAVFNGSMISQKAICLSQEREQKFGKWGKDNAEDIGFYSKCDGDN